MHFVSDPLIVSSVETLTAGFSCRAWKTLNIIEAEVIARKLSAAATLNPTYPNPFFVIDASGTSLCHYLGGKRHDSANGRSQGNLKH